MELNPKPLPSPAECSSYSEYREKAMQWKAKLKNLVYHDILPTYPSSFYFRPFFDQKEAKYKSTYPKINQQAELLATAISGSKDSDINEELSNWILKNGTWVNIPLEIPPNPEIFNTKEEYKNDYVDYNNAILAKAKSHLQETNKNGFLTIKSHKFCYNENKTIPDTIYSPSEIGKILNIEKTKHSTPPIPTKQQEKPEISPFYQWCMYRAEPYEDKSLIIALRNAYESIPYLYLFNRIPPEFQEASTYGPKGSSSVRRVYKAYSKDKELNLFSFSQLIRLGTKNLDFNTQRRMYVFAYNKIKSQSFELFDDIQNFYFFVHLYSSVVSRSYFLARASFEEIQRIKVPIITQTHNNFIEVSISSALYLMAHENKEKEIESFAKTRLKQAENRLNSFISKEGKNVAEFFKKNMSEDIAAVFGTIIKCAINIDSSDLRKFLRIFPLSDFRCVHRMSQCAPEYFNRFTFLVISSPILHIKYISELATNMGTVAELLNPLTIKFLLSIARVRGERIPDHMLYKCEWSVIAVSQLFSVLNSTGNADAAELIMQLIKFIVRGRMSRPKLRTGDWDVAQSHITGLVASIIGDDNGFLPLLYEIDAFAAMSREKNFLKFFGARERGSLILPLLHDRRPEIARIGLKMLRRVVLSDTTGFIQLVQENDYVHDGLVEAIAAITVPNSIEVVKMIYILVERLVQPERKNTENAQVGFLFAVVALPQELVAVMRLLQEGNFSTSKFLKALRAERWNPAVAARYVHVFRFLEVMSSRKTAMRMILNHSASPAQ